MGQSLDLACYRRVGGTDRDSLGVPLLALRLSGPPHSGRVGCAARSASSTGRCDCLPLSVWGEWIHLAAGAAGARTGGASMAAAGGGGDPPGARLFDVRVLLPVHPCGAVIARCRAAGGRGQSGGGALAHASSCGLPLSVFGAD